VIRTDDPQAAPEFVRNRIRMQEGYLRQIREEFDGQVRALVPLYDEDVRGVRRLLQTADGLFS
jgi:anion-transporting  ArsA/GET3 family ATPase